MKKSTLKKFKPKIYRKHEDYIDPQYLSTPNVQENCDLSIVDFNARGEIKNPRAPCVVINIDPDYIKDASTQRICKKFRMKTDILRLREITRNKFMFYATQEMYLDKKLEMERQDKMFKEAVEFHAFADQSLKKMEADAFKEMLQAQRRLEKLKENKVAEELNQVKLAHQRVLMEVQDVYGRFMYLLKLISYFDDTVEELGCSEFQKFTIPQKITGLQINENQPAGMQEVKLVQEYTDQVVRPYLAKRNHLNAEIWIKGYERNRMKVFNYNRRFTHLALLNHVVGILHEKSKKTLQRCTVKPIFAKDPKIMQARVEALQKRAHELLHEFEMEYKNDKKRMNLNCNVSVLVNYIESKAQEEEKKKHAAQIKSPSSKSVKQWRTIEDLKAEKEKNNGIHQDENESTISKVEKIQAYIVDLLSQLDSKPQREVMVVENRIRRRLTQDQEISRRALVKQNRLHNWMEHFRKHHRLQHHQQQ